MTEVIGRRERKKAQTRQALADAALKLFLERGYDEVGVKEVADAADVSVTTLFKYFPSKEALLFDQDDDIEAALVAAVHGRPPATRSWTPCASTFSATSPTAARTRSSCG